MVRTVRKGGDGSSLWPAECKTIEDVPVDLTMALEHAHTVLSWYEALPSEEIPPHWMWPFDQELEVWFQRVDEQRKDKYAGGASSSSSSGDDSSMMRNEFAKGRGNG